MKKEQKGNWERKIGLDMVVEQRVPPDFPRKPLSSDRYSAGRRPHAWRPPGALVPLPPQDRRKSKKPHLTTSLSAILTV